MTSKERVLAAIEHRMPDRCPRNAGFTSDSAVRMMAYTGASGIEELRQMLGIDIRSVYPSFHGKVRSSENGVNFDEWGIGRKSVKFEGEGYTGAYDEIVFSPLAEVKSVDEVLNYSWPNPDWWNYETVAYSAKPLAKSYWITSGAYSIFERSWYMMGMERFLTDIFCDPEIPLAVMDKILEFYTEQTLRILKSADGLIDQIDTADDIGTQRGMLISPKVWREHIKPRQAKFISTIKSAYPVKIWYHCCGGIAPIIPDLIEIGVDILDPIQTLAEGMQPEILKEKFGCEICFHGGIDTQQLLPYGTPEDVRKEVTRLIDILGRDGGYISAPTHIIQADVPPENVIAMFS